jgi:HEAT repeats
MRKRLPEQIAPRVASAIGQSSRGETTRPRLAWCGLPVPPALLILVVLLPSVAVMTTGCGSRKLDYSVSSLVKTLEDKDPKMRYYAAESLGHFGAEARPAVPALIAALKDEDKTVRMGAAYALAEIGPAAADAALGLKAALKDNAREVRTAAAYALKKVQVKKR